MIDQTAAGSHTGWSNLQALTAALPTPPSATAWLETLLTRNHGCAYLRQFGSPATSATFRQQVPVCRYEDIAGWIKHSLEPGASNVLFAGQAIACERTGGSTQGPKLIPYTPEGLLDFQRALLPWLADLVARFRITGRIYLATSPASRTEEQIGDIPLGLPDGAYLGSAAGAIVQNHLAVPLEVGRETEVARWRERTLSHLSAAKDLEAISIWSPTFFLELLRDIPDAAERWPRLKLISCWASANSKPYAAELARRLPQAHLQPKGLLSTEGVITVPGHDDTPILTRHGFVEFAQGHDIHLADALKRGEYYNVILTSASGLYRYETGDRVRYIGRNPSGDALIEFVGRNGLVTDLVGEKLTEAFVTRCLQEMKGFAMLLADARSPGYVLLSEDPVDDAIRARVEARLCDNPQYAYARRMRQLKPLRVCLRPRAWVRYEAEMLARGTRLADVKPLALRGEAEWLDIFQIESMNFAS